MTGFQRVECREILQPDDIIAACITLKASTISLHEAGDTRRQGEQNE